MNRNHFGIANPVDSPNCALVVDKWRTKCPWGFERGKMLEGRSEPPDYSFFCLSTLVGCGGEERLAGAKISEIK